MSTTERKTRIFIARVLDGDVLDAAAIKELKLRGVTILNQYRILGLVRIEVVGYLTEFDLPHLDVLEEERGYTTGQEE